MNNPQKPKIIVIVGPTASGKSDLAILLAHKCNGEIISADSRQVYKGMNIGTGKVTKAEQKMAKHYLLDVVSPKKTFTVDQYQKLGKKAIEIILAKNKVPIIVGGTGFYIDALVRNLNLPKIPPDKKLRAKLEKQTAEKLFQQLQKLDPERAKTIDSKNKRRLIRAFEIITATGKPVPNLSTKYETLDTQYSLLWLGIKWPQKKLEERIQLRLDARLKDGMISEVKKLIKNGVSYQRLFNFGLEYRQISEWLKNKNTKIKMPRLYRGLTMAKPSEQNDNAKFKNFKESHYYEKLLREIIKYSKRQMTWFKRNPDIKWLAPNAVEGIKNFSRQAEKLAKRFL